MDQALLDVLACPLCKTRVILKENKLICENCGRKYPVIDGTPHMLIEEAEE